MEREQLKKLPYALPQCVTVEMSMKSFYAFQLEVTTQTAPFPTTIRLNLNTRSVKLHLAQALPHQQNQIYFLRKKTKKIN